MQPKAIRIGWPVRMTGRITQCARLSRQARRDSQDSKEARIPQGSGPSCFSLLLSGVSVHKRRAGSTCMCADAAASACSETHRADGRARVRAQPREDVSSVHLDVAKRFKAADCKSAGTSRPRFESGRRVQFKGGRSAVGQRAGLWPRRPSVRSRPVTPFRSSSRETPRLKPRDASRSGRHVLLPPSQTRRRSTPCRGAFGADRVAPAARPDCAHGDGTAVRTGDRFARRFR